MRNIVSDDMFNSQQWVQDGVLHRIDGPAVVFPCGSQEWWQNGKRHRTDGPAVMHKNSPYRWFVNGQGITNSSRYQELTGLTGEELLVMELKYGKIG